MLSVEFFFVFAAIAALAFIFWAETTFMALGFLALASLGLIVSGAVSPLVGAGLAISVLSLAALRFIWLATSEAWVILGRAQMSRSRLFGATFLRAIPVLVLGGLAIWLSELQSNWMTAQVHKVEGPADIACPAEQKGNEIEEAMLCGGETALQDDIKSLVTRARADTERKIVARAKAAGQAAAKGGADVRTNVMDALFDGGDPAVPTYLFKVPPKCVWYQWFYKAGTCIRHEVLSPVDQAYRNIRRDFRRSVDVELRATSADIKDVAAYTEGKAQEFADTLLREYEELAHSNIDRIFAVLLVLRILWFVALLNAVGRSVLFILARLAFTSHMGGLEMQVQPGARSGPAIDARNITEQEKGFRFRVETKDQIWYATERARVRMYRKGCPCAPRMGDLFVRRLLGRRLKMLRYSAEDGFDEMGGRSGHETQFVRIVLAPEDRLAIRFSHLVAYTKGVRLKTEVSLKLAAFLKHRLFFQVACGPGEVILKTTGGTAVVMPQQAAEGSDPADFVAFDYQGAFTLDSRSDIWSVYFEGLSIFPGPSTLVVEQAPENFAAAGSRLIRKVAFFLLPF